MVKYYELASGERKEDFLTEPESKPEGKYKVYAVYSKHEDKFYIGYSSKSGGAYESYYGSGKYTCEWNDKVKITLASYDKISWAKFLELNLQLKYRLDPRCVNGMLQFRCNSNHLKAWVDEGAFEILERFLGDPKDE